VVCFFATLEDITGILTGRYGIIKVAAVICSMAMLPARIVFEPGIHSIVVDPQDPQHLDVVVSPAGGLKSNLRRELKIACAAWL
jgi:hypothetical protein